LLLKWFAAFRGICGLFIGSNYAIVLRELKAKTLLSVSNSF
jgi:hypothetical protein